MLKFVYSYCVYPNIHFRIMFCVDSVKDNSAYDQWRMCVHAKSHSMTFALDMCDVCISWSLGLDDVKGQAQTAQIICLCVMREGVGTSARAKASQFIKASNAYGIKHMVRWCVQALSFQFSSGDGHVSERVAHANPLWQHRWGRWADQRWPISEPIESTHC